MMINYLLMISSGLKLCLYIQVPVLETPDGPVFESNAIARYGTLSISSYSPLFFQNLDSILIYPFVLVTRSKADNPLHGSSLIEYVRPFVQHCQLICHFPH